MRITIVSLAITFGLLHSIGFALQPNEAAKQFKISYHCYWTPSEFTKFKSPFEYEKEVLTKRYICEEEFLVDLASRGFVQKDLELSKTQLAAAADLRSEFIRLGETVEKVEALLSGNDGSTVVTKELEKLQKENAENRGKCLKSFRHNFDKAERRRLRNFRNRIILKNIGVKSTLLNLPELCSSSDYQVPKSIVVRHTAVGDRIRKFALVSRSLRKVKPPKELAKGRLVFWLSGVVGEEKAAEFKGFYDELGHNYFPELIIEEFNSFEDSELRNGGLSLEDLWERKGRLVIFPEGNSNRSISRSDGPGAKVLLENLVRSSTYQRFFELTQPQRESAAALLSEIKNDESFFEENSAKDVLGKVLLPHQVNLLEQRAAWREVELYGVVASVLYGRLGDSMKLTPDQKEELLERAKSVPESFDEFEVAKDKRLDQELEKFFHSNGLEDLFVIAFGHTPSTWIDGEEE